METVSPTPEWRRVGPPCRHENFTYARYGYCHECDLTPHGRCRAPDPARGVPETISRRGALPRGPPAPARSAVFGRGAAADRDHRIHHRRAGAGTQVTAFRTKVGGTLAGRKRKHFGPRPARSARTRRRLSIRAWKTLRRPPRKTVRMPSPKPTESRLRAPTRYWMDPSDR